MWTPSSDVSVHVNEHSYASTNPLHSDSHLSLQRVVIRGGYHWFYMAAAWHWATPQHYSWGQNGSGWFGWVRGTLFLDPRSTSLYRLLRRPPGRGGRGVCMLTHCHHEAVLSSTLSPAPPPLAFPHPLLPPSSGVSAELCLNYLHSLPWAVSVVQCLFAPVDSP